MATEQSEHDEAAEYLSLVEAPWERPLSEAAARARQEPGPETLGHALRLTATNASSEGLAGRQFEPGDGHGREVIEAAEILRRRIGNR